MTEVVVISSDSLSDIAVRINAETTAAEKHARSAMQHALAAGELLTRAKTLVAHGEWLDWIAENCTISPRTASAYMRLAKKVPTLPDPERQRVADLPVREAIQAISTRPEAPPSAHRYLTAGQRSDTERTVAALAAGAYELGKAAREMRDHHRLTAQRAKSLRNAVQAALDAIDALAPKVKQ